MKLKFSCYTILIITASADCGLVKNFFGNVKEDVHSVVDNTVNIIGKGTHKITEGLGVFLHRNEGNKFPGHQSGTVRPFNQFLGGDNVENSNNDHRSTDNNREENTNTSNNQNLSQYYDLGESTAATVEHTPANDDEYNTIPEHESLTPAHQISNHDKPEENIHAGVNDNNLQYFDPVQPTPATVEHTSVNDNTHGSQNGAHFESPTESSNHVNEGKQETTTNKAEQLEATTNKNIYQNTTESTATNDATTTETDSWFNGVELENILPSIKHNDTHFTGNKNEGNANTESYTDTNELGTGDNITNTYTDAANEASNNKKAEVDGNKKVAKIQTNGSKADLVSDQMFFKDNKPKPTEPTHYICTKPLVRAANGECLKPIEIDIRKKNEPRAYNIFQAEGCASGYARALDNTCQRIVG